jgi:hypothetical protein
MRAIKEKDAINKQSKNKEQKEAEYMYMDKSLRN